ncbi:MAG: SpoIIE family protein phosphatase [Melioribacteraceae bacterium]|nr:SpoIIE family protein phosphatase [Melioribacteraceae bacterium]
MANKIMFVDDELDLEIMVKQYFRRKVRGGELELEFAHNGREALEKLQEHKDIDMVFSDINMPEMDGLTFIEKLTKKHPQVKAVVVSAYGDMDNVRKAMNNGAFDFVTKPIDFTDIEITMKKTLAEVQRVKDADDAKAQLMSFQNELKIGQKIQNSFLPDKLPTIEGYEVAADFFPAREVAGDFYDAFMLPKSNKMALVMADVCDKGVGAALFMALIRSLVRAFSNMDASPAELVKNTIEKAHMYIEDNHGESGMFATMFFGILDPETGRIDYVNAGHNPPIIISSNNSLTELKPTGPAVGILPFSQFNSGDCTLEKGATFFTFTDGVPEASDIDGKLFSDQRLIDFLKNGHNSPAELLESVYAEVKGFVKEAKASDDITMLAVKRV